MAKASKSDGNRPIKVLIVAPAAPLVGGQAVQANRLLEHFRREESVEVALQPINPQFLPQLQRIKYVRTVVTSARYIFDLLRRIPRYDVIHIFSASYFSFVLAPTPAVLIAKLFGKKTILNYRSGEAADHLTRWRRSAVPTIRLFDKVITPSGYLVDVFGEFGLKAQTVFNFVETEHYRFRERRPLRPVFLSNRNFEALYNVSCTLRAFALIQEKVPTARLLVAGDGAERAQLERLARELNLKNVEFLGRIAPPEMPEIYDRADIYLNSPNIDNMPNSVIEAFACGLPVISTDAGGIPYIVESEKSGLLVEKNDHSALAVAALRVLADEELAQSLISRGRAECAKYSWQSVRGEWLKTYRQLAEKH